MWKYNNIINILLIEVIFIWQEINRDFPNLLRDFITYTALGMELINTIYW